jgi:hypothetical protein
MELLTKPVAQSSGRRPSMMMFESTTIGSSWVVARRNRT